MRLTELEEGDVGLCFIKVGSKSDSECRYCNSQMCLSLCEMLVDLG
jgi:hypothetical protein